MNRNEIDKLLNNKTESGESVSPVLPNGIKNYFKYRGFE